MTTKDPLAEGTHPGFEARLTQQLQPIRNFALATSLFHLFDLGIGGIILEEPGISIDTLARRLSLDQLRLEGFLVFLSVEAYVIITDTAVFPGTELAAAHEIWPWYEMLIGGYAQTYLDMGKGLRAGSGVLSRDGTRVGSGSCKISHYDAIPLTKTLLAQVGRAIHKVIDLGCGNALYLEQLCTLFPNLLAIGVEPDLHGHRSSIASIAQSTRADRIRLYNMTAQRFVANDIERDADALIIAFVLQEILSQDGRRGALEFLKTVAAGFPNAHLVVIEVEDSSRDAAIMAHPLATSYYNPYFLVHHFTNQILRPPSFWRVLFEEAGLSLKAEGTTDPGVDSTGLTTGFLLECR